MLFARCKSLPMSLKGSLVICKLGESAWWGILKSSCDLLKKSYINLRLHKILECFCLRKIGCGANSRSTLLTLLH
jgi:hypothetical protein